MLEPLGAERLKGPPSSTSAVRLSRTIRVGPITAGRILARTGDPDRFPTEAAFAVPRRCAREHLAETAFGVVQAVNTWGPPQVVRHGCRAERNQEGAFSGRVDQLDAAVVSTVEQVLTS